MEGSNLLSLQIMGDQLGYLFWFTMVAFRKCKWIYETHIVISFILCKISYSSLPIGINMMIIFITLRIKDNFK